MVQLFINHAIVRRNVARFTDVIDRLEGSPVSCGLRKLGLQKREKACGLLVVTHCTPVRAGRIVALYCYAMD
jgi:hypothetical protein